MKTKLFFIFAFTFLTSLAFARTPDEIEEGGVLREAKLNGFGGDILRLSTLRGKPLIINVWASWCEPCRAEMGSLDHLYKLYGRKKFNLIGISIDDDTNTAFYFLMRVGVTFDNYADNKLLMENMLGADTIPLTVLIDANGKVLKKVRGFHQWDTPETIRMIESTFGLKF